MFEYLKGLLGLTDDDEPDGLETLQAILADRQTTLSLEAQYGRPTVNRIGETTARFPITLFYDGDVYGTHAKEFPIPDGGLADKSAPLTQFLNAHGIDTIGDLGDIEGTVADATLLENGHIEVA